MSVSSLPPRGGPTRFPSTNMDSSSSYRHGQPRGRLAYQPYRLFPRPPMASHAHHSSSTPGSSSSGGGAGGTSGTGSGASGPSGLADGNEFDGRRLRKSLVRKTVDYNAAIIKQIQNRVWQRDYRDRRALEPDYSYAPDTVPPAALLDNPTNAVTTRYVKSATNKMRCPIFSMAWTPEGRRLVTGASSGEFTLWNGLTFNFETILQAHDSPVRSMVWSHNDVWMVTGDHAGYVKYWQCNMNNVKMFQAHKEAVRCLTFSPSDQKFASCSDDGTVRVWDFMNCYEEKVLRGHGADVKCVDWHPHKGILVSGSKDNQQPIKIWDPKAGISLATIHAHKSTVMDARWNKNGNWLATASRDHLVKLFDIRKLSTELQVFRGHKKEASCLAWHPIHETLFASGGSDGSIMFWNVGCDKEVGSIEAAHENIIWTLAWHPVGHILCSGSNDHTSKFWTRQKPGDVIRDRTQAFHDYGLPDDNEMEEVFIPGMGPEDRVESMDTNTEDTPELLIPGLDTLEQQQQQQQGHADRENKRLHGHHERYPQHNKKMPYQKPIPKKFVAIWNDAKVDSEELEDDQTRNPHPAPVFMKNNNNNPNHMPLGNNPNNPFHPSNQQQHMNLGMPPLTVGPPLGMISHHPHHSQEYGGNNHPFNPNIGFGPPGPFWGDHRDRSSNNNEREQRDRGDRGDRERDRRPPPRGGGGNRGDRGGRRGGGDRDRGDRGGGGRWSNR